ncbi:MAG: phosphoribosylaminoimidazolesuccinocarboxamide synthase [Oscillospiraceae bacterium]|nr:phosphoribosylaminoimidazolesuccinocarboxamide synthase [Oscillospiraceae bacterium]
MDIIYCGKTKDVYDLGNGELLLKFKDDGTVGEDGKFDPGGNQVGVTISGMGMDNLRLTEYFFKKIEEAGIPTHMVCADTQKGTMTVRRAEILGDGLEVICRYKAVGSFIRRYGKYIEEGSDLPALVEITLKDDARGDPPVTKDTLEALGVLSPGEYDGLAAMTRKISGIIKDALLEKQAELYDIKLEFGRGGGKIILIDEISGGSMRVYKDGGQVGPLDIARLVLS